MATKQETCQRKKKYLDAASAKASATRCTERTGDKYSVYQCPVCTFWHLATIDDVYYKVQAARQAEEIATDAARAELTALLAHAETLQPEVNDGLRAARIEAQQEREDADRLKDWQHTLTVAAGFTRLIDAQIRARRKARKAKKLQQRKGR